MNICGIGIDIVDVNRMAKLLTRFPERLPQRILHSDESTLYREKKSFTSRATYLARQFAAKEAISKALGTGMRYGYYAKDIIVGRDPEGKPVVRLPVTESLKNLHVHISIADEKHYAIAHAILTTGDIH